MAETKIEWADYTANPWRGCNRIASGCANCYAAQWAVRFPATFGRWGTESKGGVRVVADLDKLFKQVRGWDRKAASSTVIGKNRPPIVFWNDVSDTFDPWQGSLVDRHGRKLFVAPSGKFVPDGLGSPVTSDGWRWLTLSDVRRRMFAEGIDPNQNLIHVLLTKRPGNVRPMWPKARGNPKSQLHSQIGWAARTAEKHAAQRCIENCWLLYSASDQPTLDAGCEHLWACMDLVPVLGYSIEPLLGPLDLRFFESIFVTRPHRRENAIRFVIIGCEQLPGHKPGRFADGYADAALSLIRQCREAGVPVFHKQMPIRGRVSGDPSEWPEEFRVREFPQRQRLV